MLKGAQYMSIAKELEKHAAEELKHALIIAKQIDYLGGMPTVTPKPVKTSEKAEDMLRFDLDNENETIRNYRERVRQCEALGRVRPGRADPRDSRRGAGAPDRPGHRPGRGRARREQTGRAGVTPRRIADFPTHRCPRCQPPPGVGAAVAPAPTHPPDCSERTDSDMSHKRRYPVGAEVVPGGAHFRVWAPARRTVGGRGRRRRPAAPLEAEGNGYFAGTRPGVGAGTRYRFRLDGGDAYPDPASRFQPDGPHGPSEVVDPAAFGWTDRGWRGCGAEGQVDLRDARRHLHERRHLGGRGRSNCRNWPTSASP